MIVDRDPGDETDAPEVLGYARDGVAILTPATRAVHVTPAAMRDDMDRILSMVGGTGTLSQRALERLKRQQAMMQEDHRAMGGPAWL